MKPNRRSFVKTGLLAAGGLVAGLPLKGAVKASSKPSLRPPVKERKFKSKAVEEVVKNVTDYLGDTDLSWMFENCFPNTLDTTVNYTSKGANPDTFVITGDIHAMWLRDSTAQVWPYVRFCKDDEPLRKLVEGVIRRQNECIIIDPYANAFNDGPGHSEWMKDLTDMKPELHERKWEIDSLCYPIRLSYGYWEATGDGSLFDDRWEQAMRLVLHTFKVQQRKEDKGPYRFQRVTEVQSDTVAGGGYGNHGRPNGLILFTFRPSDDATLFFFPLSPSNHFAVISLRQLATILSSVRRNESFAAECRALADEVEKALSIYGSANHVTAGRILAYETDGFGNFHFMDDANVPSLLSLPYLGAIRRDDPLYLATRKFILSPDNPWFFSGKHAHGIGSPHTGPDKIWPIALTMRGLTADNDYEIVQSLKMLAGTHANTGFMHESFNKDNPFDYTRKWFAWANTLFGELVYNTFLTKPELLKAI